VAVALLTSLGAVAVLRLWDADLGIPFAGSGDALFFQMFVKDALEQGWVLTNPELGAPFGQELHDFPVAGVGVLHVLAIKSLGLFSSNPAAVLNAYFLLSFPLSALSAFAVLRWLRLSCVVAVAAAVLFALAPYHFLRGESHLLLAVYFQVPLSAYLILAIYLGSPLLARRADAGRRVLRYVTPRTLTTLAICVVVGLSDVYYVAFTALLAAAATLIAGAVRRQRSTLVTGAVVTISVVAVAGLALSPNLVYRAEHGDNPALARHADESEAFSLNLTGLIMPVNGHRLDGLAGVRERYSDATRVGREAAPLGLLAGIGFLWLLGVALALCLGAAGWLTRDSRQRSLATANLTALLIGTTGGVSAVIAYGISPELRTWSRLSIFIAFFALAALGLVADAAWERLARRRGRAPALGIAALAAVVVIGVLDQTSPSFAPRYTALAAEYESDRAFVSRIEGTMGAGAPIFQLPYMRFPDEDEFARLQDYDLMRGYLHSRDLRWSYGAMKGRPQDWQAATVNLPLTMLVPMVSSAGFQGIYLDRFGYSDDGATAERELERILGAAPFVSADERLAFFDLRPYIRRLRAARSSSEIAAIADVTLHPLRTAWPTSAFNAEEERDGNGSSRWAVLPDSRLQVVNPSSGPRPAVLSVVLARPGGEAATTTLRYPDGSSQRVRVKPEGTPVLRRLRFPPGESSLQIATPAPPVPEGVVKLTGLALLPEPALPDR
jgi:hypothetical protein